MAEREGEFHIQYCLHENNPNHMLRTDSSHLFFTCQLERKMLLLSLLLDSNDSGSGSILFCLGNFKIQQGWGLWKGAGQIDIEKIQG